MSLILTLALAASLASDTAPYLPPPPRMPGLDQSVASSKAIGIDPLNRSEVAEAYQSIYLPQQAVAPRWTGSLADCVAGSTAAAHRTAVMERINFFRALAGVPGVIVHSSDSTISGNTQAAALMMSAQGALSHAPPTGWACYSAGGAGNSGGAGSANLALGVSGPAAIDLYMNDPGVGNEFVGHRRWILYPPRTQMATGDVPDGMPANALWVFGPSGPRPATPAGVAWPPRGYVPYQLLPSSNRWSLSLPGANFSAATVSMTVGGQTIPVTVESRAAIGYGDNTIVWRPSTGGAIGVVSGPSGVDRRYDVTLGGITGSGVPGSVSYSVMVIDGLEPTLRVFASGFE